jgi:hypothetical protein
MKTYRYENMKALTFSSIMSAISVVFTVVAYLIGDIGLFLILILPLCSSLVSVSVKFKYALIYIVSTLLISLIDFQLALFIILPCLISGLIFGRLIRVYLQGHFIILINALVLLIMQFASTYLINFIYEIDLVQSISKLLLLKETTFKEAYLLFLFMISLIQSSLSFMIISSELKKLDLEFNEKKDRFILTLSLEISFIILTIIIFNVSYSLSLLLLGVSSYIGIVLAYYIFSFYKKKNIYPIQIGLYFISIIAMMASLNYLEPNQQVFTFLIPLFSQLITSGVIIIYQKIIKKSKITFSLFDKLD